MGATGTAGVRGDEHPDAARIELEPSAVDPALVVWRAHREPDRLVVDTGGDAWFVLLAGRPHVLLAFDARVLPPGSVIDEDAFTPLPVRSADQLGGVRWDPPTGVILDLWVKPEAQGRRLARHLCLTAGAVQTTADLGPALRASGARSDAGEAFAQSMAFTDRIGPRTAVARIDPA